MRSGVSTTRDPKTRPGVEDTVGLAGHRAPHDVADGDGPGALLPGLAQGRQRVGGLPRLGDRDREDPAVQDR